MDKRQKATMADVAKHAGVSPSTATRVISQSGYVSEENRRRVEEAVRVTGYRPNIVARSLRTQRSFTLGLVLTEAATNLFFARVSQAVNAEAQRRGYSLLTINHGGSRVAEHDGLQRLRERSVEAIIFCHALDPANLAETIEAGVPVVQIERQTLRGGRLVLVNQEPGVAAAVDHLLGLGHRRIAFLAGNPAGRGPAALPQQDDVEAQRIEAFLTATARAGIAQGDTPIVLADYEPSRVDVTLASSRLGRELLARDPRPTAIFCGSDLLAAGVLRAVHEMRLRAPDDVSVIGYDDSFGAYLSPPLTTVAQPLEDLGRAAIDLAVEAVEAPSAPRAETYPTRLVVRRSTGPAPA